MSIVSGLLGNASEANDGQVAKALSGVLIDGERVEHAFVLIRDMLVFTSKRLIIVNKQGITGKKRELLSLPYGKITMFSKENAGHFDLDAELKIWIASERQPVTYKFRKGSSIDDVYKCLAKFVLS